MSFIAHLTTDLLLASWKGKNRKDHYTYFIFKNEIPHAVDVKESIKNEVWCQTMYHERILKRVEVLPGKGVWARKVLDKGLKPEIFWLVEQSRGSTVISCEQERVQTWIVLRLKLKWATESRQLSKVSTIGLMKSNEAQLGLET
ncbi:hypothetical protein J6590_017654 [Homalodisca vitripennis]|nr:hypothetical protein J6590_017654 [Homalodisca vitripennis]